MMQSFLSLVTHPKKLLLLDAIGALATALTIYFVLASELVATGVPFSWLRSMAFIGLCYVCFDLLAYRFSRALSIPLFTIAALNGGYCVLATIVLIVHETTVTRLGWSYFCTEIGIIAILAAWECTVALRFQHTVEEAIDRATSS